MRRTGTPQCGPVVVGVNGSPNSIVALNRATDTARRLGADLDIVLAVAPGAGDPLVAAERDGSSTVSRCVDNARCAVEIRADQHASAA